MEINKKQDGEKLVLSLSGRLDTITAPILQEELIPTFEEMKEVELDLVNLTYVSSAGLRILLLGQKTAMAKSTSMTLSGVSDDVMEVFDMTGFSDILTIL